MTVADLLFQLQLLDPKKPIYIESVHTEGVKEVKNVLIITGRYVLSPHDIE